MVDGGGHLRLTQEARPEGLVIRRQRGDELDGHRPIEGGVGGPVDDAHAAPADDRLEVIAAEVGAQPRVGTTDRHGLIASRFESHQSIEVDVDRRPARSPGKRRQRSSTRPIELSTLAVGRSSRHRYSAVMSVRGCPSRPNRASIDRAVAAVDAGARGHGRDDVGAAQCRSVRQQPCLDDVGAVATDHLADHVRARLDGRSLLRRQQPGIAARALWPAGLRQRQDEARLEQRERARRSARRVATPPPSVRWRGSRPPPPATSGRALDCRGLPGSRRRAGRWRDRSSRSRHAGTGVAW